MHQSKGGYAHDYFRRRGGVLGRCGVGPDAAVANRHTHVWVRQLGRALCHLPTHYNQLPHNQLPPPNAHRTTTATLHPSPRPLTPVRECAEAVDAVRRRLQHPRQPLHRLQEVPAGGAWNMKKAMQVPDVVAT